MEIALEQLEQQIDETILERGFKYFQSGRVLTLDELGGGDYEIAVKGTELYTVNLSLKGNRLIHYECDCPYDEGVCKHVVAALFYLREELLSSSCR